MFMRFSVYFFPVFGGYFPGFSNIFPVFEMSNREKFSLFFPPSSPSKSTALRQIFENLPSHSSRVAHALLRKVSTQGINNTSLIVSIRIFARRILLPARSDCGSTMPASISLRLLSFLLLKEGRRAPRRAPTSYPSALIMPTPHLCTSHLSPYPTLLRIDDVCLHFFSSSFLFLIKDGRRAPRCAPKSCLSALKMLAYVASAPARLGTFLKVTQKLRQRSSSPLKTTRVVFSRPRRPPPLALRE